MAGDHSPSQLRRLYADVGVRDDQIESHVTFTGVANNLAGCHDADPAARATLEGYNPQTLRMILRS
jgi:hypothetical protein